MRKVILSILTILSLLTTNIFLVNATNDLPYYQVVKKEEFKLYGATVSIEVKHIENVSNQKIQKQINHMIDEYFKTTLKKQANELKNSPDNSYVHIYLSVTDYYNSKDLTSLSLDFQISMADSFTDKQFHTIDLNTGEELKLSHWLPQDYKVLVKEEVLKQIALQNKDNGSDIYFMDEVNKIEINDNQPYYINKKRQLVIVFPMYQIAPAYVGLPEFIIPYDVKKTL